MADSALSAFSDWTLVLLPRLFLYPGGIWALGVLLLLRFACGGLSAVKAHSLRADFARSESLVIATAWASLALMPLPGTAPLPFPIDRFALAGLLATSFLLARRGASDMKRGRIPPIEVAMTLAVLAPMASSSTLLRIGESGNAAIANVAALSSLAVGLCLLWPEVLDMGTGVRWLGWLGLGAVPLWDTSLPFAGIALSTGVYALFITASAVLSRVTAGAKVLGDLEIMCWALAAFSLLVALLG